MLATVYLNDQIRSEASEIYNIPPNRALPAKPVSIYLAVPDPPPQDLFRVSEVLP